MNDVLEPSLGDQAIRYSMLLIAATAVLAGLMFWLAGRFIVADAERTGRNDRDVGAS